MGDCWPAGGGRPYSAGGEQDLSVKSEIRPENWIDVCLCQKVENVKGEGGKLVVLLASKGSPALRGLCRLQPTQYGVQKHMIPG